MNYFIETLIGYLNDPYISKLIWKALAVGIPVALCASLLGVTLVLKRYSMIGDGLSHVGFGALAIATALNMGTQNSYGLDTIFITLPIVIIAAFLLLRMSHNSKVKGDAAIALISTGAIAIGYIIYNLSENGEPADVCSSLFGKSTIIYIDDLVVPIAIGLAVAVLTLYFLSYSKIFSITFDEDFAYATGVKVKKYNMLIALLTAVTIVLGMQLVGAVMISGLIVFPTVTSMQISKSFKGVVVLSGIISVISFVLGFIIAAVYSIPIGPSVIAVNLVAYIVIALITKLNK